LLNSFFLLKICFDRPVKKIPDISADFGIFLRNLSDFSPVFVLLINFLFEQEWSSSHLSECIVTAVIVIVLINLI